MKGIAFALALALAGAACAGRPNVYDAKSGFEALKGLAGTWTGTFNQDDGKPGPATVTYEVTSGGSAIRETLFPGQKHEMTTMYYREGKNLVLVHYCAMGNQPKMRLARIAPARGTLKWEFAGGANIDPRRDVHMHEAKMKLVDENHLEANWTHWKDGKPSGTAVLQLTRAK